RPGCRWVSVQGRVTSAAPPSFCLCVDRSGELVIFFRDYITCVMGAQFERHLVPRVRPRGMVVHLFSNDGYARHETKGFGEVAELKGFLKSVVCFGPHN